jgi:ornithine cyclodeaminase/alanine dehydrogenase-like protein (mu-crystallin family)
MQPLFIDAAELTRLLPITDAVDALDHAFRGPLPLAPQRARLDVPGGELLLMPSAGASGFGVKLVTVAEGGAAARELPVVQAAYVLFDTPELSPIAVIDGTALTALRTAAVSALATRYLARSESRILTIIGAGVQGFAHLDAMLAVRPIEVVWVVSRGTARAEELVARAVDLGLHSAIVSPEAVAESDIVCTCTTSSEPVFDGSLLPPGCHVNAIGAYRPDQRELDDLAVRRGRIVVETREAALAEAGDLMIPLAGGVIEPADILAELPEVVRGQSVRRSDQDITVFKSVGVAFEDLVVATAVMDRAGV